MMKKVFSLVVVLLLAWGSLQAQTSMMVPNGSFEQWTSHPAYNVSVMMMSLPVYDSYSTPTGWDYLSYPVNQTFNVLGSNVTINTSIPLIKASQESGAVPDSNSAVKLETFMLSDLVTGLVYALAAPNLDPMLTSTVFPSILATGEVNIDSLVPLITTLLANTDSIESMLTGLAATDVNSLITGGIALGSFEPSRLTGSYKYHSGDSVDNGGVLLLGTHYNTAEHRREVVGGGVNIALTDVTSYTPFTVDYQSLHELDATFAEQTPDSLIILLVSSASENREQGSYLCVDNLRLWQDTAGVVPPPDTCVGVTGLAAVPSVYNASLSWSTVAGAVGYELEYGAAGFAQGSGTMVYPTGNTAVLNGLAANTTYDVYVRANCSGTTYGEWGMVSFTTLPDTCVDVVGLAAVPDIHEAVLTWNTTAAVVGYEVEYGTAGFVQGNGTMMTVGNNTVTITRLTANTAYDVYVRTVCGGTTYGNWASVSFTTQPDTCGGVRWMELVNVAGSSTNLPQLELRWQGWGYPDHWEVEYGPRGFELGTGTMVETNETSFAIYELEQQGVLQPNTWYDFYVRSVCHGDVYGEWDSVQYRTFCASIEDLTVVDDNISVNADNMIEGYMVTWVDNSGTEQWGVLFGTPGQDYWDTVVDEPVFRLPPLRPHTMYAVGVMPLCGDDNYGEIHYLTITTISVGIAEADASVLTVSPNPADGRCVVSLADGQPAELKLYGADGRLLQTIAYKGTPIELQLPSQGVFLLQATTSNGTTVRKIVNK